MNIMLCGASDTKDIEKMFEKTVRAFGAEPKSFLNASHYHEDSLTSTSEGNSIASVDDADICVFVVYKDYGSITWEVEFKHAIREGKPFIILCKAETRQKYYSYKEDGECPEKFREMYNTLSEIESIRQLNLVPFELDDFSVVLTSKLSAIMEAALGKYTEYQRRKNSEYLLHSGAKLTASDIKDLIEIATDEYESKKIRKDIIERLSGIRVVEQNTVLDLIGSPEQGVSRLALDKLDQLLSLSEYTQEFLDECVIKVSKTEDTGAERRLVQALLRIDVSKGLRAISDNLPIVEIGTKRRLAAELINHKEDISKLGIQKLAIDIGEQCSKTADNKGWRDDIKAFVNEMKEQLS